MARFDVVPGNAAARQVIFSGTPSQVINAPAFIKGILVTIAICVTYAYASARWTIPWSLPLLAVLVAVGAACLRTAFTEIIIDTERITCRDKAVKAAGRRVTEVALAAGEQREQAERA